MTNAGPDTHQKALSLNLDPKIYGTIAEIGAGQEVSRWFFHVGGAAGTVAKTISAYDMVVSDELYGKGTRYVSRDRVASMLEHEFKSLVERLSTSRAEDTRFFVFADSVSARNYAGTNECHGWLGLRCQLTPDGEPNDILLHVNMNDATNQLQQEAIGILGVNLIHGAYHRSGSCKELLTSLAEGLAPGRVEIDTLYCSGPELGWMGSKEIGRLLVEYALSPAVLFDSKGTLTPPTEAFYKRPLLLVRSAFDRAPSALHAELMKAGLAQLEREKTPDCKAPLAFCELSLQMGPEEEAEGQMDLRIADALRFTDMLLLTRFRESYKLTNYLRRYASKTPIRFALGASTLYLLFQERYYHDVPGNILEGLGRLFAQNVRAFVMPMPREAFDAHVRAAFGSSADSVSGDEKMVGLASMKFEPPREHLFRYLCSIEALQQLDPA